MIKSRKFMFAIFAISFLLFALMGCDKAQSGTNGDTDSNKHSDEPSHEITYTLAFDARSGSETALRSTTVKQGNAVGSLPVPTKTDDVFIGWFSDVNFDSFEIKSNYVLNSDKTIYALYESDDDKMSIHGKGTLLNPFRIYYKEQLDILFSPKNYQYDGNYKLMRNIDYDNHWTPIGADSINTEHPSFIGIFDGNNKTISGLVIEKVITELETYWGFFTSIGNESIIKNLTLEDLSFSDSFENNTNYMGGIVAQVAKGESHISNCVVKSDINIEANLGYIENSNLGKNSTFRGRIYIGLIAAAPADYSNSGSNSRINLKIENSSGFGSIVLPSFYMFKEIAIGGIMGLSGHYYSNCEMIQCRTGVEIDVEYTMNKTEFLSSNVYLGGTVGKSYNTTLSDCETTNVIRSHELYAVNKPNFYLGGLIGNADKVIVEDCRVLTDIKFISNEAKNYSNVRLYIGGAIGRVNDGNIDCLTVLTNSKIELEAIADAIIGGLIGVFYAQSNNSFAINNSNAEVATVVNMNPLYETFSAVKYGGFVGTISTSATNSLSIDNSSSTGTFESAKQQIQSVGGFVAESSFVTIDNCFTTVNLTSNNLRAGGFAQMISGNISNCYSTGNVWASYSPAGFISYFRGQYNTHTVTLLGSNGTVQNSYSTGNVNATDSVYQAAGFIAHNDNIVINCYATGNVLAYNSKPYDAYGNADCYIGGLVAYNGAFAQVVDSYATGNLTGNSTNGAIYINQFIAKDVSNK